MFLFPVPFLTNKTKSNTHKTAISNNTKYSHHTNIVSPRKQRTNFLPNNSVYPLFKPTRTVSMINTYAHLDNCTTLETCPTPVNWTAFSINWPVWIQEKQTNHNRLIRLKQAAMYVSRNKIRDKPVSWPNRIVNRNIFTNVNMFTVMSPYWDFRNMKNGLQTYYSLQRNGREHVKNNQNHSMFSIFQVLISYNISGFKPGM